MKATLAEGGHILLDRYVYSNIAYQCAKLKSAEEAETLREWIFNTEYGNFELPRPDLNIFLDVPIGLVESKLRSQRGGADRDYLEGLIFHPQNTRIAQINNDLSVQLKMRNLRYQRHQRMKSVF